MASINQCLASMARLSLATASRPTIQNTIPKFLAPSIVAQQTRNASGRPSGARKREKKKRTYARAFEVGQNPLAVKYDLAVKLKTLKSGPVIKSRIRLPHPVKSDRRIGVICREGSALAIQARRAGAVAAGEESLFQIVREGTMDFTAMICDQGSADALAKANLGRLLGPKGLMPSVRTKTISNNVLGLLKEMAGADSYREKDGVVRLAVGQLGFSPEMLAANVKAFVGQIKDDCAALEDQVNKEVHEVVLSTTHGPGFSLNGGFNPTEEGITPAKLTGPM
ncbi:54S ribosomal protein L1, mitochondrial [Cytospora mali]|uniref:54S ribosomal protein L1, mitochondrial n=1 Tax=Cytospora mali TaxID=578113 RepID=A0A194UM56_CYTMA|nr:54S ribosomal protein L1, mitochondrial [Valsa mali var. pyri (nom. inval.)]